MLIFVYVFFNLITNTVNITTFQHITMIMIIIIRKVTNHIYLPRMSEDFIKTQQQFEIMMLIFIGVL